MSSNNSVLGRYNYEDSIKDKMDFWKKNSQFEINPVFKKLKKDNKDSSLIMWGIAFLVERVDNEYSELVDSEKLMIIEESIWDKKYKLPDFNNLIEEYKKLRYGILERQLEELEHKLEDRGNFLSETNYNIDNAKILDGLIVSTDSLIDKVMSLRKKLYESGNNEGKVQGDRTESFLEKI